MTNRPFIEYFETGALPIYIGVCFDAKKFAKEMKRLHIDSPPEFLVARAPATTHHFSNMKKRMATSIICLDLAFFRQRKRVECYGLCIHEAVHAWQEAEETMREKYTSREFEAYTVQWFAQCVINEVNKTLGWTR